MVIRVISGDNELQALDFQKHYRMPAVYLMDSNRSFERQYNRNGWPFLVLVNAEGNVVYQCNNLAERDKTLMKQLHQISKTPQEPDIQPIGLVPYRKTTLEHNGEKDKALRNERFTSIACGHDDAVYTVYTAEEDGESDVYLRIQKGDEQTQVCPVAATQADEYDGTVIIDTLGNVWICWTSNHIGRTFNIYLSNLESIQANKTPILISQSKEDAMHGRLAVDESNNIWITYYKWQRINNISRDKEVYVRKYANGVVSSEIHVSPDDVSEYEDHTDPDIAVLNNQPVVCWSWDFHKPEGYTQDAEAPTIFGRQIKQNRAAQKAFHISAKAIDMTPALGVCYDTVWCAWDSMGYKSKSLCVRPLTPGGVASHTVTIVENLVNVCNPNFAFHTNTKGILVWCQTENGVDWSLCRADYDFQQKKWCKSAKMTAEGNPRFASCVYDSQGQLWLAYSIQTDNGRKVVVKQTN